MRGPLLGKLLLIAGALAVLATAGFTAAAGLAATPAPATASKTCPSGYVLAVIAGQEKCLHAGEYCSAQYESDYERYGFTCVNGHLESSGSPATTYSSTATLTTPTTPTTTAATPNLGRTVLLRRRTRIRGCRLGALPDRHCSPGAYYSGLTQTVICSTSFRTGTVRNVPQSEKYSVEREYGLRARHYGRTLEIDHIVSLELGGSNSIANLYPEEASFRNRAPGYHVKDKLENRLHDMVCSGEISLHSAQQQIAANWEKLYRKVYGVSLTAYHRTKKIPRRWKNCGAVNKQYPHGASAASELMTERPAPPSRISGAARRLYNLAVHTTVASTETGTASPARNTDFQDPSTAATSRSHGARLGSLVPGPR